MRTRDAGAVVLLLSALIAFGGIGCRDNDIDKTGSNGIASPICAAQEDQVDIGTTADNGIEAGYDHELPYSPDPFIIMQRSLIHLHSNLDRLTISPDTKEWVLPFFHLDITGRTRRHEGWDWSDLTGRYVEAIGLARNLLGINGKNELEVKLRRSWLNTIGQDGLAWRQNSPFSDHEADVFDQSSSLLAFITLYELEGCEKWLDYAQNMISGLLKASSTDEDGGIYFRWPTFDINYQQGAGQNNFETADPAHHGGRLLFPLARFLSVRQAEEAEKLARGITNRVFGPHGVFDDDGRTCGHVHSRISTIKGLFLLARLWNDCQIASKSLQAFRLLSESAGPLGIYPEFTDSTWSESCAVSDALMASLAGAEALAGIRHDSAAVSDLLRDQADLIYFNHLTAAQARYYVAPEHSSSFDRSLTGAWPGFSTPLSWGRTTMNCCSPAGVQGVYAYRDRAVQYSGKIENVADIRDIDILHLCPGIHIGTVIKLEIHPAVQGGGKFIIKPEKHIETVNIRIPQWLDRQIPVHFDIYVDDCVEVPDIRENYRSFRRTGTNKRIALHFRDDMKEPVKVDSPAGRLSVIWNGPFAIIEGTVPGFPAPPYHNRIVPAGLRTGSAFPSYIWNPYDGSEPPSKWPVE